MSREARQVRFELPRPVASSKNRRVPIGRGRTIPSDQARADVAMIRAAAAEAAGRLLPFGPDDALELLLEHDIAADRLTVTVRRIGTLPRRGRRGTRRDAHGMLETLADALQGVLFPDDRQIDCGSWRRRRDSGFAPDRRELATLPEPDLQLRPCPDCGAPGVYASTRAPGGRAGIGVVAVCHGACETWRRRPWARYSSRAAAADAWNRRRRARKHTPIAP